jgi:hypothetical protein
MMAEEDKLKLHALIIEISKLSAEIDALKIKRELLLDNFKNIQLVNNKLSIAPN